MINNKLLKTTVSICFGLSLLAGCSSSKKDDAAADADVYDGDGASVVETEAVVGGIGSGGIDDSLLALDAIFYFDFDKSELRLDVRAQLDEIAVVLQDQSGILRLEGHADERGTREYNLALGERRAMAIANYLAIQGVPGSQIESISYGEEKPAAIGHSEEAWAKNRRVELIYID